MNKYIHYFETMDDFKSSSYYDEIDRSVQLIEGFTIEGGEVYISGNTITGNSSETTCDFDGVYVCDHFDSENYRGYIYKCNEKELLLQPSKIYTKLCGLSDATETNSYPICVASMTSMRVFKIKSPVLKTYAPPKEITVSGYTFDGTTTHESDGKYFLDSENSNFEIIYKDNIDNPAVGMSFPEIKIGECFETGDQGIANIVAISGDDFYEKPWVSLCEESNDVDYVIDVNDNKYNYIGTGDVSILS